uniref:VWFC domain-containing protein n=1 Tax=Sphaeramia orbicularis TaxID=375764 RepID=A0A672YIE2_9TELE
MLLKQEVIDLLLILFFFGCDESALPSVMPHVRLLLLSQQNNTSWRPQTCQECTCYSDVAICRTAHCPNPQCDFQRGEHLRIPANKCCPECVSSQGSCTYEGVVYGHDSQWSPSPCSLCICSGGGVSCTAMPCPPLSCPPDHSLFTPDGECCPKCGRNGESCSWQESVYRDGEQWKPSLCSRCLCRNGDVQCSVAECQQVACKPHENLVIQPGQCCPQCVSNPCLSAGKQYQHGEQWQKNACTTCVCDRGQSKCQTSTCRPLTCEKVRTYTDTFHLWNSFHAQTTLIPLISRPLYRQRDCHRVHINFNNALKQMRQTLIATSYE